MFILDFWRVTTLYMLADGITQLAISLFVFRPKILTFLQLAGWSHVTSKKSVTWHLFLSTAHRFKFNPKSNRFYGKGFCVDFDLLLLILNLTKFLIFSNGWVSELFWMYNWGFLQSMKVDLCIVNFYYFWKIS